MLLNKISKLLTLMNTLYVSVQSKTKQTTATKNNSTRKHEGSALLIFF